MLDRENGAIEKFTGNFPLCRNFYSRGDEMKDLSYRNLIDIITKKSWEDESYEDFLYVLKEAVASMKSEYFYPRNLFLEDKLKEVIFFHDKTLTIVTKTEKKVHLQIKKYDSIVEVNLESNGRYNPVIMIITFNDGSELILNPEG